MRFVVFAAYKGGVGRTTAAASIGNALARCGKRVLLIDMDLDAPSLPGFYGFGIFKPRDELEKGLPQYWSGERQQGVVPWLMHDDSLSDHLLEVEVGLGEANTGSIHVLPAGQVGGDYIPSTMSPKFRGFFETGIGGEFPSKPFGDHLTAALEACDRTFDFVLIDARSGLGPVSQHLLAMPATVVFLTLGEPDSLLVLNRYLELKEKERVDTDFIGVLSRAPLFGFEDDADYRAALRRLAKLCGDEAVVLREQPGREIRMAPTIRRDSEESLSLAHDHLRLMLQIAPELALNDATNVGETGGAAPDESPIVDTAFRRGLEDAAERMRKADPYLVWKMFRRDLGVMLNSDNTRNVAFRVTTIESVFSRISSEVENHFKELEDWRTELAEKGIDLDEISDLNSDYLKALFDGGQAAGHGFGDDAADVIQDSKSLFEKVEEWAKFDEDVGFGSFSVDVDAGVLWMVVTDSFLSRAGGAAEIFEGYVSGVMQSLLHPSMEAESTMLDSWLETKEEETEVHWKWSSRWPGCKELVRIGWQGEALFMQVEGAALDA